jgi:hypothetical protein
VALSSRSRIGLLVFAAAGGLFLLVIVGGIALIVLGRTYDPRAEPSKADAGKAVGLGDEEAARRGRLAAQETSLPTREEFAAKMIGKTKEQVLAALGKPETDNQFGNRSWTYRGLTRDAITGKGDYHTTLWFDDAGKVSRVTHSTGARR